MSGESCPNKVVKVRKVTVDGIIKISEIAIIPAEIVTIIVEEVVAESVVVDPEVVAAEVVLVTDETVGLTVELTTVISPEARNDKTLATESSKA